VVIEATGFSVWIELESDFSDGESESSGLQDRVGVVGHLFGEIIGPLRSGETEFQVSGPVFPDFYTSGIAVPGIFSLATSRHARWNRSVGELIPPPIEELSND